MIRRWHFSLLLIFSITTIFNHLLFSTETSVPVPAGLSLQLGLRFYICCKCDPENSPHPLTWLDRLFLNPMSSISPLWSTSSRNKDKLFASYIFWTLLYWNLLSLFIGPNLGTKIILFNIFHALHVLCSSIQSYSLQVSWQSDSHPLARELLYLSESFDVLFSVPVILWGCIQASSCWGLYLVFSSRNVEYHFLSPLSSLFLKLLLIKQWLSWITIRSSRFQILYILYFLSLRPSLPFERFSQLELLVSHWMSNFSHHSISESSFFSDCTIL